jgi:hypothetical protein
MLHLTPNEGGSGEGGGSPRLNGGAVMMTGEGDGRRSIYVLDDRRTVRKVPLSWNVEEGPQSCGSLKGGSQQWRSSGVAMLRWVRRGACSPVRCSLPRGSFWTCARDGWPVRDSVDGERKKGKIGVWWKLTIDDGNGR